MQDKWVQELPDPCKTMELLNDPKHLNRSSLLICPYSKDKAEVSLERCCLCCVLCTQRSPGTGMFASSFREHLFQTEEDNNNNKEEEQS